MKLLKHTWPLRFGHKKKATNRSVSTWSPLATAFNTRPTSRPMFDSMRERTVSIVLDLCVKPKQIKLSVLLYYFWQFHRMQLQYMFSVEIEGCSSHSKTVVLIPIVVRKSQNMVHISLEISIFSPQK